jgi:hypothetical protein
MTKRAKLEKNVQYESQHRSKIMKSRKSRPGVKEKKSVMRRANRQSSAGMATCHSDSKTIQR